jgi:Flp pilus assembly protein TadD
LHRRERRGQLGLTGARTAVIVIAIAAAAIQVPGLVSTERVRDSQAAARSGDYALSEELAQDSVSAAPWAATPREQLALVFEARGEFPEAASAVREAISRERTNWQLPLLLARIQVELGDRSAAQRTIDRGNRLWRNAPTYSITANEVLSMRRSPRQGPQGAQPDR